MTIGSLFSGIGGLELGLERSGIGSTVWQVERDHYCRQVLANHWPEATRYDDVRTVGAANLVPVDLICGGFPCQDVSSAGKREGLGGARSGLWFEYLRIVGELRPTWVVVENVASGAAAWVDAVLAGLGGVGYACLPVPLSASDIGAPHRRARVFIVAHLDRAGQQTRQPCRSSAKESRAAGPGTPSDADQHREHTRAEYAKMAGAPVAAYALRDSLRVEQGRGSGPHGRGSTEPSHAGWQSTEPSMVRMVHGVPAGLDRARIAALGNAVVPTCAEVIGHIISQLVSPGDA